MYFYRLSLLPMFCLPLNLGAQWRGDARCQMMKGDEKNIDALRKDYYKNDRHRQDPTKAMKTQMKGTDFDDMKIDQHTSMSSSGGPKRPIPERKSSATRTAGGSSASAGRASTGGSSSHGLPSHASASRREAASFAAHVPVDGRFRHTDYHCAGSCIVSDHNFQRAKTARGRRVSLIGTHHR